MIDQLDNSMTTRDIDPRILARLQELAGLKITSELVVMYLNRGMQLLESIRVGLDIEDYTAIKDAAHSLISSAGNLGGNKVSGIAKQIEHAAIEKESHRIPDLIDRMADAQEIFQRYLNKELEKL